MYEAIPGSKHLTSTYTGIGLKSTIDSIHSRTDFKIYMQNYAYACGGDTPRGPRHEGSAEDFDSVRHPRFLFGSSTNLMASYHHCRPQDWRISCCSRKYLDRP